MFASAFMRLVLKRPAGWFSRGRLWLARRMMLTLLHDAAGWCRQTITNRTLLAVVVALTLAVETLPCLSGPLHSLKLTPRYWDVVQLPGRFVQAVLQTVAWWTARVVAELVR